MCKIPVTTSKLKKGHKMHHKAYSDSAPFIIDPVYSAEEKMPPDPCAGGKGWWLYGQYEFEAFMLERMCREKDEAKLKVRYTKFRRTPQSEVTFSAAFEKEEVLFLQSSGKCEVLWEGKGEVVTEESRENIKVTVPGAGVLSVKVVCSDIAKNLPALRVTENPERWRCQAEGFDSAQPVPRPARIDGIMPHHAALPQVDLEVQKIKDNVWDAGKELFCYVEIVTAPDSSEPELFVGESIPEMENNDPRYDEQTRELLPVSPGVWRSKVPLALRYIRVENAPSAKVTLKALFHPAVYRGAFAVPEDEVLTRIWMHSAYTLRLCMMNFLNDGIKRDRLPWAGDLAVSLMGNAYSFGDGEIIKDSLSVLGAVSARTAHINTIVDYTLWHIISHDLYQKFFGDMPFLEREYPRLTDNLEFLLEIRSPEGLLQTDPEHDWLFIDWVPGEKLTALQMLFIMALKAGAALAERMKDPRRAAVLLDAAEQAAKAVKELCFDREKKLFAAAPGSRELSRHANMMAIIAGIADEESSQSIADALSGQELPPVGTPYMSVFEALALARCGRSSDAIRKIREIWGGMLSLGATSFWEGFDPSHQGNEHLAFYTRPFGKSLCHAWSAGPLFLLTEMLLGVRVEKDGWKEFSLSPLPGVTLSAVIPIPGGAIEVECINGQIVELAFPEGVRKV